ncbi:MAG: hypothetical protein QOD38_689 [Acidimicrobiaceae bacterium]|jgi:hypothetical protein
MEADANLLEYGRQLADAIEAALPGWVSRSVEGRWRDWQGTDASPELVDAGRAAGERAAADVAVAVRALLELDVDEQRVNPLALVRRAVSYPTDVLRAAGVPPVVRGEFDERTFPDDIYGLTPASFADVDPALHEPGLFWGAAKAHAHLSRRRS